MTVRATDYGFQAPTHLPAGPVTLAFENAGRVPHELNIGRLKPQVTLPQLLAAARSGAPLDTLFEPWAGILIADPGRMAPTRLQLDLVAGGTYAWVCTFRDAPDAPRHSQLGMVAGLTVE